MIESTVQGQNCREERRVALITGGSRGIGAATALALAGCGYDIALTYRDKVLRAREVVSTLTGRGGQGIALPCDLTRSADRQALFQQLGQWTDHLDALVLNASGGLEREILAIDPEYPLRINRDAQVACVEAALPFLSRGSTLLFVPSHWAHLNEQIRQFPAYDAVARSKYAGEQALRTRLGEFQERGIRFIVVTGDLIEGTVTPKLLERLAPDLIAGRRAKMGGQLPTAQDMGKEIASAIQDTTLAHGSTIAVGEALQSLAVQMRRE